VAAWAASVHPDDVYLSVLTLGEIRAGIERLRPRDPDQASVFDAWLAELRARFPDRLLEVDERVADIWGRLNAPSPRKAVDSLIAAIARTHELTVVTGNTRDFDACNVPVLNPWEFSSSP
jgi:predicted nucleic acid-binding protein